MQRRGRTAVAAALFMLAALAVGWRIWRNLDSPAAPHVAEAALVDFRDAVYYPVIALLAGENPYDRELMTARHPVHGTIGLYSPLALLLHLPWGLLPYRVAEAGWMLWSLGLMLVLAAAAWHLAGRTIDPPLVLGLGAFLVVSRPGHWNLFLGQVSLEAALATLAALWWAPTRPALAGLGLALTTFKPTYAVPLALLLAARRNGRALAIGTALTLLLTLPPLAVVVARVGLGGVMGGIATNYERRVVAPEMSAKAATFRVDVGALAGQLLGRAPDNVTMLVLAGCVLLVAACALQRLAGRRDAEACRHALEVGTLAILLSSYHQQYDLLLLAPLLVTAWPLTPLRVAQLPAALIGFSFVNYLGSGGWQRLIGLDEGGARSLSAINTVALLAAFGLVVRAAGRARGQ